jgi:hypothetical protein
MSANGNIGSVERKVMFDFTKSMIPIKKFARP